VQFWAFLKGAGLRLDEAVAYFGAKMAEFNHKQKYLYSLEYTYGKRGKCVEWKPFTCKQILAFPPPSTAQQAHGCPFQRYSSQHLRSVLADGGLS